MSLFALRFTQRHFADSTIPTAWFPSMANFYLILFAFPLAGLYRFLAQRKWDVAPPTKTALSLVSIGICFLIMFMGSKQIPPEAKSAAISPFYLVFAYAFYSLGEMLLNPIGLSLVTHLSPKRYTAFLVGIWYLCIGVAFYIGGVLAGLISSLPTLSGFFNIFVLSSFIPAGLLFLFVKKLDQMRHAKSL
jgi:POT family proton-dependent oligopeptide transporter